MSDSEEDDYQFYGKLLEPYDEDAFPKKKAFSIEDQIATDEQGRRRFHGAFTGGFSAGFFNTVGSLEGWKPADFKSSRSEKAEQKLQTPHDFMDDEDVGQFGIAPVVVRATSDYSNKVKRKRIPNAGGPIPGVPVLHSLLEPAKDTVGIRLLKKMGWKPGQGVGPRVTKYEKRKSNRENNRRGKIYGCEIPDSVRPRVESSSDGSDSEDNITFAPSDYDPYIYKVKDNKFGMGYSGLDKRSILSSHISLFDPPEFSMKDHKNSKISVSGQAFGVGAFENEDEDIYARDDMSKYDFELDSTRTKSKIKKLPPKPDKSEENVLEGFAVAINNILSTKTCFPPPTLPKNFIPKHGVRLSRFEPLPETHRLYNVDRKKNMGRHDLTASERSKILNSEVTTKITQDSTRKLITMTLHDQKNQEKEQLKENVSKVTKSTLPPHTPLGSFKPFMADPDKQKRYEEYLVLVKIGEEKQITEKQPASFCNWEREREINEFAQASRMFKPVSGLIFDKFVTASSADDHQDPLKPVGKSIYHHGTQEMRDAAEKKMFGALTRDIEIWKPNRILCKRFNVPEPEISEADLILQRKKKSKFSVFDYYEAYQQNKTVKEGPETKKLDISEEKTVEQEKIIAVSTEVSNSKEIVESTTHLPDLVVENYCNKSEENKSISDNIPIDSNISQSKTIFVEEDLVKNLPSTSSIQKNAVNLLNTESTPQIKYSKMGFPSTSNQSKANKYLVRSIESTELPKVPKVTLPINPKEKKDLFKAIFLSSSESEDENEELDKSNKQSDNIEEIKKTLIEDVSSKTVEKTKPNPAKGIFADLDWSKINKPKTSKTINEQEILKSKQCPTQEQGENTYGPKLPVSSSTPENIWKPTFRKIDTQTSKDSSSSDCEWMEVGSTTSNTTEQSNTKTKKHKKHKSKHKKHKSKSKKKKR